MSVPPTFYVFQNMIHLSPRYIAVMRPVTKVMPLYSWLFANVAGVQRPLQESIERLVDPILAQYIF